MAILTPGDRDLVCGISTPTGRTAGIWPPDMPTRPAAIKAEWDPQDLFRVGAAL
jgi:hypothetical protein